LPADLPRVVIVGGGFGGLNAARSRQRSSDYYADRQAQLPSLSPAVAAGDIENQIDSADVFEDVVVEVDELLRAEVERLLTVGSASGADTAFNPTKRISGKTIIRVRP